MLKLKPQYFGHLMRRTDSLEKTLMLGKIEGRRRRGQQRMRWLDGFINSMDVFEQAPGVGDGQGGLACCSPWGHKELDMTASLSPSPAFVGRGVMLPQPLQGSYDAQAMHQGEPGALTTICPEQPKHLTAAVLVMRSYTSTASFPFHAREPYENQTTDGK